MNPEEILRKFNDVLEQGGIFTTPLRQMGWMLIKVLVALVNVLQGVVQDILTVNGFFDYKEIDILFTNIQPVLWGALLLIILYIGYQLMLGQIQEKSKIIQNLMMSLLVIFLLPTMMVQVGKLTNLGIEEVLGKQTTMAEDLVLNQMTDLRVVGMNGWRSTDQVNHFQSLQGINIIETMSEKDIEAPNNEVLKFELEINEMGESKAIAKKEGKFNVIDEKYFRWDWNFWMITIQLGFIAATFLFTSLKTGRILFELAFHQMFASITAFLDIQSGQKLKEILKHIVNTFIVLFFISLLLRLYIVFGQWLQTEDGISEPLKVLLVVCAGLAVIDGPNIVERVLGIDAGLQSGFKTAAGMYAAAKGVSQVAKGASKAAGAATKVGGAAVSGAVNGAVGTAGFVAGSTHGAMDRVKELKGQQQKTLASQAKTDQSHNQYGGNKAEDSQHSSLTNKGLQENKMVSSHSSPSGGAQAGGNHAPDIRQEGDQNQSIPANARQSENVAETNRGSMMQSSENPSNERMTSRERGSVTGIPNEPSSVQSGAGRMNQVSRTSLPDQMNPSSRTPIQRQPGKEQMDVSKPSFQGASVKDPMRQSPEMGARHSEGTERTNQPGTGAQGSKDSETKGASQTAAPVPTLFEATKERVNQVPIVRHAKRTYAIGHATTKPKGDSPR